VSPTNIPTVKPTYAPTDSPSNKPTAYRKPGIGGPDDWSYCVSSSCSEGQGDCDGDNDCKPGLICGTDNCQKYNSQALSNADCCMRKLTLTSRKKSARANKYDGRLDWFVGSNRMITGFSSYHNNHREDREWSFHSAAASGVSCRETGLRGYANAWDKQLTFVCPDNQALSRVYSHHSNYKEDRKWKFGCCAVSSNAYLQRGGWTNYVNGWDKKLDFRCFDDEVLVGLKSIHSNYREDRRWKFHCSKLMTKRS